MLQINASLDLFVNTWQILKEKKIFLVCIYVFIYFSFIYWEAGEYIGPIAVEI